MSTFNPVFIVGTGRSGTTLLRALLNAHPDLHISKESSFLLATNKRSFKKNPSKELQKYFQSAPFHWLQLSSKDIEQRLPPHFDRATSFQALLEADAHRYHKTAWGDKTPAHWLHVEDILHYYPHAVVIHLIRDPRQVIHSLLKMPWGSPSIIGNALYYERCIKKLLKQPNVKHILFSDLLKTPVKILKEIIQWMNLSWSDQLLEHHLHSPNDMGGVPWLEKAYQPLISKRVSQSISPAISSLVEKLCPTAMDAYFTSHSYPLSPEAILKDIPKLLASIWFMGRVSCWPVRNAKQELRMWLKHNPEAFQHWPDWDIEKVIHASFHQ